MLYIFLVFYLFSYSDCQVYTEYKIRKYFRDLTRDELAKNEKVPACRFCVVCATTALGAMLLTLYVLLDVPAGVEYISTWSLLGWSKPVWDYIQTFLFVLLVSSFIIYIYMHGKILYYSLKKLVKK
jgi:hypothetical protein